MSFILKNIFENNIIFLYQVLAGVQIWLEVSGHGPFHVSNEPWTLHSGWFETISSHPAAVWCDNPIIFNLSLVPLDLGKVGGTGCLDLKMVKICNFMYFRSQAQCPYASGALIRIYFHPKAAEKMAPPRMARLDLVNCSWECDGSADCSDDHGDVGDLVKGDAHSLSPAWMGRHVHGGLRLLLLWRSKGGGFTCILLYS